MAFAAALIGAAGSLIGGFYQAQVANNNATIERQNAAEASAAGQQQAEIAGIKGAAQGGQIKAAQAANGIDVNSGSALDVQTSQKEASQLDAETVLNNANLSAYGYTTQAVNDQAQAGQDQIGAVLGAAGSLVGGASSLPSSWTGGASGATGAGFSGSSALGWGG